MTVIPRSTEKRRKSTRNRGEPPFKKRAATPPPAPQPQPTAAENEKGLPLKLQESQILPTLTKMQDQALPDIEYQSIMESGVLAASIEQSRRKWAVEGVFERYWAKPSKKKNQDAQNPSKESMSRLGLCSLVIEPHVFEITLYTVREPQNTYHPPVTPSPVPARPFIPPVQPTSSLADGVQSGPHGHPQPNPHQLSLPPFREGFAQFDTQGPPQSYHPSRSVPPPPPASNAAVSSSSAVEANGVQLQSPKPSPDPVIQMLATRAASDHGLKQLMKVVASGRASQAQLRDFQNHIDDLNAEIKAGRGPPPLSPPHDDNILKPPPSAGAPSLTSVSSLAKIPGSNAYQPSTYTQPVPIKVENPPKFYHQYQPLVKPKSVMQYKSDINAIVFDFGGTGDRFSFPRFSILEYLPGGNQVIVSFLVIRKGDSSLPGKYKENLSYYQPVTMRLSATQSRTLEPLAKVVAPAEEVRKYMDSVFDKMSPTESRFLATRLPRAREEDVQATNERSVLRDDPVCKTFYPPPNSLVPLVA
ncbi:MAG: hypothetical protein Q9195_009222 [Heterodermia aff. obscurata]